MKATTLMHRHTSSLQLAVSVASSAAPSSRPQLLQPVPAMTQRVGAIVCPDVDQPPPVASASTTAQSKLITLTAGSRSHIWSTFSCPTWTAASVSVGRWHRPSSPASSFPPLPSSPGATLWGTTTSHSKITHTDTDKTRGSLPNPALADLVIGFGDGTVAHGHDTASATTSFPRALDAAFPGVQHTIGIVAGPTPFVTGTPFTLYAGESALESGFVGAALIRTKYEGEKVQIKTKLTWDGLVPLGGAQVVTRAQGNVVLEVVDPTQAQANSGHEGFADGPSPTALLIKSLGKGLNAPGAKERRVFAAVSTKLGDEPFLLVDITAGDPSRGFLALATHLAIQPGWAIQFLEAKAKSAVDPTATPTVTLNGVEVPCPHGFTAWSSAVRMSVLHTMHARLNVQVGGLEVKQSRMV